MDKANVFLSYAYLKSPISGTVDYKRIELGELTTSGMALMRIVDTKNLRFETSVKESDINKVAKGNKVIVNIDSLTGSDINGVVAYIVPTGNKSSHTYNVMIDLEPAEGLRIGMYGKVNWRSGHESNGQ